MNFIFDMDGVLVQYDRSAYVGDHPAYLKPHYFKDLLPVATMVNVVNQLLKMHDDSINIYVKSTASSSDGRQMLEQYNDKAEWLAAYLVGFHPAEHFLLLPKDSHKSSAVIIKEMLLHKTDPDSLSHKDILIDDFNENLYAWEKLNGFAIKFNNGINAPNKTESHASFEGLHLSEGMPSTDITNLLLSFHKN